MLFRQLQTFRFHLTRWELDNLREAKVGSEGQTHVDLERHAGERPEAEMPEIYEQESRVASPLLQREVSPKQ
jgi:hypothetical protein